MAQLSGMRQAHLTEKNRFLVWLLVAVLAGPVSAQFREVQLPVTKWSRATAWAGKPCPCPPPTYRQHGVPAWIRTIW